MTVLFHQHCEDDEGWFRNYYHCEDCGHEWTDEWSCMCDDDCTACGSRHWSPFKSEDIDENLP